MNLKWKRAGLWVSAAAIATGVAMGAAQSAEAHFGPHFGPHNGPFSGPTHPSRTDQPTTSGTSEPTTSGRPGPRYAVHAHDDVDAHDDRYSDLD